jgi:acetyl-CoA carboxylase beta subunit
MDNTNSTGPIIPPMQSDPNLKSYYCPHCDRFLFKGNVKKLNMVCHYCQKMISADEKDLMKPETE